jgi:hypothetical protein
MIGKIKNSGGDWPMTNENLVTDHLPTVNGVKYVKVTDL